jgi:hypothetical protein
MAKAGVQPVKATKVISDGTEGHRVDVSAHTIVFTPNVAALRTAFSRSALQVLTVRNSLNLPNTVSLFQVASCILVLFKQRPSDYMDKAAKNPRNELRSLFSEIQDMG